MQDRIQIMLPWVRPRQAGSRQARSPASGSSAPFSYALAALGMLFSVAATTPARSAGAPAGDPPGLRYGTVSDIDGNRYRTVVIGKQEWMIENLRTTRLNDGTPVPLVQEGPVWSGLTTPAYAWYDNNAAAKETYGALYNWFAVSTGKLAPAGWRVPSHDDWTNFLTKTLGGESITGGQVLLKGELKSRRTAPDAHPRWDAPNADASNATGFNALPGGHRNHLGPFNLQGKIGFFWSATAAGTFAWYRGMRYDNGHVFMASGTQRNGFSVRCVRDLPE